MKFSFQMVFITFVVTLAHLVVLATLSPIGRETSDRISKSDGGPAEELEIESFPVVGEIPLTATEVQPEEETKPEPAEPPAVSENREKHVEAPKPADLAEVFTKKSERASESESPQPVASGPHEIRRIEPKPRS